MSPWFHTQICMCMCISTSSHSKRYTQVNVHSQTFLHVETIEANIHMHIRMLPPLPRGYTIFVFFDAEPAETDEC